jgi:hypothetical protein
MTMESDGVDKNTTNGFSMRQQLLRRNRANKQHSTSEGVHAATASSRTLENITIFNAS